MTNYLIVQALNIACLVGLGRFLVLRTRADVNRQARALHQSPAPPTREAKRLELRSKIESLQRELSALEEPQPVSALRSSQSPN